ncbi:MAG: 3-hydroxyacyl-CoA dehydrogenase NAD-binding domain-containing protein [Spirochaetota bacterium]
MSDTRSVTFTREGAAGLLTIDLPGEKLNVLRSTVVDDFAAALSDAESAVAESDSLEYVVVKSGKPGCFVAGADLKEIVRIRDREAAEEKSRLGQELMARVRALPVPTIALVSGTCLGGGLELALACDYRVVTDHPRTSLGLPETNLGIVPGFGGTYRLPKVAGMAQAVRMILTGKPVDAMTAVKRGLADALYPDGFAEEWTKEKFVPGILTPAGRKRVLKKRRRKPLAVKLSENNPIGRAILFRGARKQTLAKTHGNYPAPLRALRLLRTVPRSSAKKALRRERAAIAELIPSPIAQNLVSLFLSREAAKRQDAISGAARHVGRAVVLGAGVMGGRISWLFSHADIPVVMKDIFPEAIRSGYESAHSVYDYLRNRGKYSSREVVLGMHKIHGTTSYDDLGLPDLVVEAVVENPEIKSTVLSEVESRVAADTVIATNTSSLTVDELAASLDHPERFGGMHFFNPANRMPLVEVVAGSRTSAETVRTIGRLAVRLGKVPVVVNDCPGFLVNRLLMPYLNEALVMAEEGEDFARVDRVIEGFGMPMGPFRLLDEVGLDIAKDVAESLIRGYGERMRAGSFLSKLGQHHDLLGKKAGKGFYLYGDSGAPRVNPVVSRLIRESGDGTGNPRRRSSSEFHVIHRPMFAMLNEAARALDEGIVDSAEHLDLALVLGIGFAPFRGGICRYADTLGISTVNDTLRQYADDHGARFEPAAPIVRLAEEGGSFRG